MTADREALVAEVAGMLAGSHFVIHDHTPPPIGEHLKISEQAANHLAHALADLLAARKQQARAEALREAAEAIDAERASIEPKNHAAFAARLGMSNAARLVREKADA